MECGAGFWTPGASTHMFPNLKHPPPRGVGLVGSDRSGRSTPVGPPWGVTAPVTTALPKGHRVWRGASPVWHRDAHLESQIVSGGNLKPSTYMFL